MIRIISHNLIAKRGANVLHNHATDKFLYLTAASDFNHYSTTPDEREYLHRSSLPTYHFQKSLLRLPIPKLETTCERYLKSQKPLLSTVEYAKTENIVKNFQLNEGAQLNKELVANDKNNKHTSYISAPWFDMYLKDRSPVVLTHNPFMVFNDDPRPEYNTQLLRATNMIFASARFMKTLRAEILEPEVFHLNPTKSDTPAMRRLARLLPQSYASYGAYYYKAYPLDMSQYGQLFNSTRIPRQDRDELFTDSTANHLLVMRKGNFYVFPVLDANGNIRPVAEIQADLKYILNDTTPQPEFPVGIFTTENRNTWAKLREQLVDAGNENVLKQIDSAMFALVLDDEAPTDHNSVSRQFLHSDGINRWYDKSFQLILNSAGTAAVNFEHAWGDGVAVLRYFKEVFRETTQNAQAHPSTRPASVDSSQSVQRLEFKLNGGLQQAVTEARQKFETKTKSLDIQHLEYTKFTRKFVKEQKISPDSVMQLAIQLAYHRQTGEIVGTYESCSTAAFKHGRTETVRSCTMATKKICDILASKSPVSVGELQEGIRECSTVHQQLTKEAAMGQGFDRHLFALRTLAQAGGKMPALFTDPSYKKLNHIILSTSTLSDPAVLIGGFAAVVPDGFGVGYSIEDDRLGFNVTSYPPPRDVNGFIQCCVNSLDDIYDILQGKNPARKS